MERKSDNTRPAIQYADPSTYALEGFDGTITPAAPAPPAEGLTLEGLMTILSERALRVNESGAAVDDLASAALDRARALLDDPAARLALAGEIAGPLPLAERQALAARLLRGGGE